MKTLPPIRQLPELKQQPLPPGRSGGATSGLTVKQETFAHYVASGTSYSAAYRHAYNTGQAQPRTVHKRASELANRGDVAGRITELLREKEQCEYDYRVRTEQDWWRRVWAEIDPDDIKTSTPSSRVSALKLVGDALGIIGGNMHHPDPQPRLTSEQATEQIMTKLAAIKARQQSDY